MLVSEYMTADPVSVGETDSILDAAELMKEKKVRRFPVLRDGTLIGIVTDRDLRSAAPSQVIRMDVEERKLMPELHDMLAGIKIKDIMSRDVLTVGPGQTIMAAAKIMLENRISGLPVTGSEGELLGIITETDIFKVLVDLSGISSGKTAFAFDLQDVPGSVREAADAIRAHGGRVESIMTSHALAKLGFRRVYIRARGLDTEKLPTLEEELRERFDLIYMIEDGVDVS
jgi:acetoin utilization protein AcuB